MPIWTSWTDALDCNCHRVAQSLTIVAHLPMILLINASSAVIAAAVLSDRHSLSERVALVALLWSTLIPLLVSWLRLRHRAVPQLVSRRRIITLIRYSAFLGIVWSIVMMWILPHESVPVVTFLIAGIGFLCIGCAAALSSLPLLCLAFSVPVLATALIFGVTVPAPTSVGLVLMVLMLMLSVGWLLVTGWAPLRRLISLASENTTLLASLRTELERQQQMLAERDASRSELLASEQRFRALAGLSSDWYWQQDTQYRFVNAFEHTDGRESPFKTLSTGKTRWEIGAEEPSVSWDQHRQTLDERKPFADLEFKLKMPDGVVRWLNISGEPRFDNEGIFLGYHGVGKNISERKANEAIIEKLAYFDALTDLPNRRFFIDRLKKYLQPKAAAVDYFHCVIFIDLDHFKNVNDAHGHGTGDLYLAALATRLAGLMRAEDVVARLGGDEFVVLGVELGRTLDAASEAARAIAEKIRIALLESVHIDGHLYCCSASIGVTIFPRIGESSDDLLREADTAMFRAKAAGRNRVAFYEATMHTEVKDRVTLEIDLMQALDKGQIHVAVQSQVDHRQQVIGAELLVRWDHPLRGAISPVTFIPLTEDNGFILPLGAWVLHQACLLSLQLRTLGHVFPLSINVSPKQFRQTDFVQQVRHALTETGATPEQLIFEVTEGLLIDDLDATISRMHELAAIGIRFSIDDFGTGYSSLAYLQRLPLYELKIDRRFIGEIPTDTDSSAIVQAILSMARHLQLRVVAEGVESAAQVAFLREARCDAMQGYFYSRPVHLTAWITQLAAPTGITPAPVMTRREIDREAYLTM